MPLDLWPLTYSVGAIPEAWVKKRGTAFKIQHTQELLLFDISRRIRQ